SQTDAGRQFHFVSTVPAPDLNELGDRARRSDDLKAFIDGQLDGKRLQSQFNLLADLWGSAERAWRILRSTYVAWPDEREVRASNAALAGLLLTGAAPLATVAALSDLITQNLAVTLDEPMLLERLRSEERRVGKECR